MAGQLIREFQRELKARSERRRNPRHSVSLSSTLIRFRSDCEISRNAELMDTLGARAGSERREMDAGDETRGSI